jgi:hypothetical protein
MEAKSSAGAVPTRGSRAAGAGAGAGSGASWLGSGRGRGWGLFGARSMPRPMRPAEPGPLRERSRPVSLRGEWEALGHEEGGCEKLERKADRSSWVASTSPVDAADSSPALVSVCVGVRELRPSAPHVDGCPAVGSDWSCPGRDAETAAPVEGWLSSWLWVQGLAERTGGGERSMTGRLGCLLS